MNRVQWIAFAVVLAQLTLVSIAGDALVWSWVLCLTACALWGWVAIRSRLTALLVQQVVIAALSMFSIWKLVA